MQLELLRRNLCLHALKYRCNHADKPSSTSASTVYLELTLGPNLASCLFRHCSSSHHNNELALLKVKARMTPDLLLSLLLLLDYAFALPWH